MTDEELAEINQLKADIEALTQQIISLRLAVDNSSFVIQNTANKEITLYSGTDAEFGSITTAWSDYVGRLEVILADKQAIYDAL